MLKNLIRDIMTMPKIIGFIGLGKMGKNMVLNLLEKGYNVIAYNRTHDKTREVVRKGSIGAYSLTEMISKLPKRKIVWLMIKHGKPVDDTIKKLIPYLKKGDILIDGGNSWYKDSIRRHDMLKKKGIRLLDCGTSGGIEGARHGASMMIGGDKKIFKYTERLFKDMCVKEGYGYMGSSGAGHFVKMVHNGIEYGMMGAINEGFLAIEKHSNKFGINLKEAAKVYAHGSIIESKLISWLYKAFNKKKYLRLISCEVPKGETEDEMKKLEKMADMKILHDAIMMRDKSRKHKICCKLISAMRNEFGGHPIKKIKKR